MDMEKTTIMILEEFEGTCRRVLAHIVHDDIMKRHNIIHQYCLHMKMKIQGNLCIPSGTFTQFYNHKGYAHIGLIDIQCGEAGMIGFHIL